MKNITRGAGFARLLLAGAVATGLSFSGLVNAADPEFSYNGDTGPGYWSELDSAWAACAGVAPDSRQSPIDIDHAVVDHTLKPLALQTYPTPIDLINNGHTIEEEYEGTGSAITFEGKGYELQQFHFHSLSEHAVNGERGNMELHAVFQDAGTGDRLVVGLLFEIGRPNPFLQTLIDAGLPKKNGNVTMTPKLINLADVLTSTSSYYTYAGSLTTPPCTENVTWIVLAKAATLSQAQFQAFRHILGNDFRPLQRSNGRVIRSTQPVLPHWFDPHE
jgi:carbonic anhydrase